MPRIRRRVIGPGAPRATGARLAEARRQVAEQAGPTRGPSGERGGGGAKIRRIKSRTGHAA